MPPTTPNDQLGDRGLFADASNFDQRYIRTTSRSPGSWRRFESSASGSC
jgi:hypothetical protein